MLLLTPRDPRLAKLSPEELQTLEAIARKLAAPLPDTPQNQTESNLATIGPERMQERTPSGDCPSGCDGLFEAISGYHQRGPSRFPGKSNDEQHVIAIDERL